MVHRACFRTTGLDLPAGTDSSGRMTPDFRCTAAICSFSAMMVPRAQRPSVETSSQFFSSSSDRE